MTAFTFDTGIPNANNNPSIDQPGMQINNVSTDAILAVDHVSFETNNGGTHKKVTYIDKITSPTLPVTPGVASIGFTANGVADTNTAQNYFKNLQGTFPLSAIRAFGSFDAIPTISFPAVPVLLNGYNVSSLAYPVDDGNYIITLETNAVTGNNVVVFYSVSVIGALTPGGYFGITSYIFTNPTLTIQFAPGFISPTIINFLVMQI